MLIKILQNYENLDLWKNWFSFEFILFSEKY